MPQQHETMSKVSRRLLGLIAGQAPATTALSTGLLTGWIGKSLRPACSVWAPAVGLLARSTNAATVARSAEEDLIDVHRWTDGATPGDEPENDRGQDVADEAGPTGTAVAEHLLADEPSTEPELSIQQQLSTEPELSTEQGVGEVPSSEQTSAAETINVAFRLPSAVNAEVAHVCGDFNDWSMTADPMDRLPDGSFELTLALPVGRRWRFRYLLDATRWENDWAADDYTPNALGDQDSVVDLRTPSASLLAIQNRCHNLVI